jgi:hypothetical protein
MKATRSFTLLMLVVVTLTNCTSTSEEINKSFKTINDSLALSSRQALTDSLDLLYKSIDPNKAGNAELAFKASQVYLPAKTSIKYIDALIEELKALDSTGEDIDVPTKLLVNTPKADTLQQQLLLLSQKAQSGLMDDAKADKLREMVRLFIKTPTDVSWSQNYFERTPTVAAMTILSKFRHDCRSVAILVLQDLRDHQLSLD